MASFGEPQSRLTADNLAITYADARGFAFKALDVSGLAFLAGKLSAVTGPSGCGKSSLLCALSGIATPPGGEVVYRGQNILALGQTAREKFRREMIGFVFQDFQLVRELSALENVLLAARFDHFILPAATVARAQSLLDDLGVPSRSSSSLLSRGEAQRVAIARALLRAPPIILADEPTASLDAAAAQAVITRLQNLAHHGGKIVVCVTHDPALVAASDLQVRLDRGRLASMSEQAA